MNACLRLLVKKIHPIPRIETTPIAMGIRSARSNEGRGCIPGKVLPRLYPHSFHGTAPGHFVEPLLYFIESQTASPKRCWTEAISVRLPFRRRGLARALIAQSLRVQKQAGMTESALGVDSENLSGATKIYEACGFRVVKTETIYKKPLITTGQK
ncbi:MAG: GNAT family N-acetyltransferase [Anaerolineales bacterium]